MTKYNELESTRPASPRLIIYQGTKAGIRQDTDHRELEDVLAFNQLEPRAPVA